jgi:hypothetical protein
MNKLTNNQPELIKYIPQNFLEHICNEIGKIEETEFDKELKNIIFSHIDESNRLGMSSLENLLILRLPKQKKNFSILGKKLHEITLRL